MMVAYIYIQLAGGTWPENPNPVDRWIHGRFVFTRTRLADTIMGLHDRKEISTQSHGIITILTGASQCQHVVLYQLVYFITHTHTHASRYYYKPTRNKTCFPFFPFFFLFVSLVLVLSENSDSLAMEEEDSPHAFLLDFLSKVSNSARLDGPAEDGKAGNSCCKSLLELTRGVEVPLHGVLLCIGGNGILLLLLLLL